MYHGKFACVNDNRESWYARIQSFPDLRTVRHRAGPVRAASKMQRGGTGDLFDLGRDRAYASPMITVGEMVREFVVLNQVYALGQLTPEKRRRWQALGHIVNLELARFEAREQGLDFRRNATRALVRLPVQYLSAAVFGDGETVDLSCGGCAFNSRAYLRPGDEIELTVNLPGSLGPLHPTGKVRWAIPSADLHGCQAGVAFAEVDDLEREVLMACVLGRVAPFFAAEA